MVSARAVEYDVDGTVMVGRLAIPDDVEPRPGVLIAHEGPGVDDHQLSRADLLAELGYVSFALDYHGGGRPIEDREQMGARLGALRSEPETMRRLGVAGLDILCAEPSTDATRLAAIGYCFGGTLVLELARGGADLRAVVGFHAGLGTTQPHDAHNIRGRVLVCLGTDDPFIPPEQRRAFEDEMRAGGVDWTMHLYGGVQHSFTHDRADQAKIPGVKYDARADRQSWRAMLDLFDEVLT